MNPLSLRYSCAAVSFACLIFAFLVVVYLSATGCHWQSWKYVYVKLAGCTAVFFSLYFASCTVCKRLIGIQLLRNKQILCLLGAIATQASVCCLFFFFMADSRNAILLDVAILVFLTLTAATCIRAGTGWRAFGVFSLLYGLPLGLLSIGPVSYFIFPPPPDPVGGHGINTGIVITWMIPIACNALPAWIASLFIERWLVVWHFCVGLLCLPGSMIVAWFFLQILT